MDWRLPKAIGLLVVVAFAARIGAQDTPVLPEGLEPSAPTSQPALPTGLGDEAPGPALPSGLGESPGQPKGIGAPPAKQPAARPEETTPQNWLDLSGFWEIRGGVRTQRDRYERQASIGETRLQLSTQKAFPKATFKVTADLLYDPVVDRHRPDLEIGEGLLDLREAWVSATPLEFIDVKIGRQILTWGTGDLVFINDLFPKDWRSYFSGRDQEYLKAPSDAVKAGFFSDLANLNLVFTPRFDHDRFIRGRRISYYSNAMGRRAGRDAVVRDDTPDEWFRDFELAGRISKNVDAYELAAYGYWGYWKSPAGMDPATGRATFPRLNVYGASVRGPALGGIANAEVGYYDSRDDRNGDDPLKSNSELRLLVGYERELSRVARDLTVGTQYYVEILQDYAAYRRSLRALPAPPNSRDEYRHVVTARITKLMMNQNLELSLFGYYSPSDSDAYLRPRVKYKIDDHWSAEVGGNVFFGADNHTFFAQFRDNTNAYAAVRYGF
jgi:hypothetical protein